jgi:hypothetical protein
MEVEGEEVDVQRDDVPGEGCKEEGCPKYYESGSMGRCGACDCFVRGMGWAGKGCPVAVKKGYVRHEGPFGQVADFADRFY